MASQIDNLPASSQLSSVLSDPPLSDHEELGEITVDLNTTSIAQSQNSYTNTNTENAATIPFTSSNSEAQPRRQSQRQKRKPLYRADYSEDELGAEIQASPSTRKSSVPVKRSRSDSSTKPTSKPAAKRTKPAVDRKMKKWEPEFVTQDHKSPLVTNGVDLRTLLLQPAAWDVLSADDKREILSFFPADTHILDPSSPNARPNVGSLSSNDTFRHDAEEYVSNIAKGMHDLEWLRQAWAAHQRRAIGDFDEFYIRKVEVDWSTDIPDEHRPQHLRSVKSGASSSPGDGEIKSMDEAPKLGGSPRSPEMNGVPQNETLEQNGSAHECSDRYKNGDEAHIPDGGNPNGTPVTIDSITVYNQVSPNSNGDPRFHAIPSPAQSDAERVFDYRDTTNGAVNSLVG